MVRLTDAEAVPEEDVWSLDVTLARWILPRLKRLREVEKENGSSPVPLTHEGWLMEIDMMLVAFELIATEQDDTTEQQLRILEGLNAFHYWMRSLWT